MQQQKHKVCYLEHTHEGYWGEEPATQRQQSEGEVGGRMRCGPTAELQLKLYLHLMSKGHTINEIYMI